MRIHITGNAGSGKSTFARDVGDILGINVYGLDKVVWQAGWQKTMPDERRTLENRLVAEEQWIIEGVSAIARQAADMIVLLDLRRGNCFVRCAKRNWRYLFRSRPGLPDNCPEFRIIPRLMMIIWRFPELVRPTIIRDMHSKKAIRLSSQQDIDRFLTELSADQPLALSRFAHASTENHVMRQSAQ